MFMPIVTPLSGGPRFRTDFSEYTTGLQPSDWTIRGNSFDWDVIADGAAIGGKILRRFSTGGGNSNGFLTWDKLDSIGEADVEVLTRVRTNAWGSPSNGGWMILPAIRHSGTWPSYIGGPYRNGGNTVGMVLRTVDSSGPTLITDTAFTWALNTWYWVRFRAEGNALKLKIWSTGSEPSSWLIETTDSNITTAGRAGLFIRPDNQVDCDFFSVAYGGGRANGPG